MLDGIINILNEFLKVLCYPILWACKQFFYWFSSVLIEELSPESYAQLKNFIPDINSTSASRITPFLGYVNEWIPLDVAFSCLTIYFEFLLVMVTIKLVIKLFIPTLG